ncbi:MAG: ribonuclease R [Clostridia bacterium]|nr:ribonuclease R [Clostridia bacterium]
MDLYGIIKEKFITGEFSGKSKKQIFASLSAFGRQEKNSVEKLLGKVSEECGMIFSDGKYLTYAEAGLIKGEICGNERGYAFLVRKDEGVADSFIPARYLHGAEHKDEVLCRSIPARKGKSDEVEVVKILKRGIRELCGTYYKEKNFGFLRPDEKKYYDDIYIPFSRSLNAESGDKVLTEIEFFPEGDNPQGAVKKILGKSGDLFAEENSIISGFGYEEDFSEKVKSACAEIETKVADYRLIGRLDLENELIITIDGDDSRDFDDALNVKKLENGNYLLGVHIADVSEYVKKGDEIDREAYERSTSVYFPDRVIPMLPRELSNGICSLNEGERRLTLSCIMEIDGNGNVVDGKLCKSYIRSRRRMTYKKVEGMLDGDEKLQKEYSDIFPMIRLMSKLQEMLSAKRDGRGSIDLDVKEAEITYKDGEINVSPRTSLKAYKIIEEFMVLCNEYVAEYCRYAEVPFVYRIHEAPSADKVKGFKDFLSGLGINVKWKAGVCFPGDFSALLRQLENTPVYPVVNKVMLRSMQKAIYSPENKGHFGLASKCYCHFTSPIRRYPDLVVHRVVKALLDGQIGELNDLYGDFVVGAANISSENERRADDAERQVDELYKVKFIERYVGCEFDGVISGVTASGVYTELENTVEGFTRLSDLPRGRYVYDEKNLTLWSGKRSFRIGERVHVGVLGVNVAARRIDFIILNKIEQKG